MGVAQQDFSVTLVNISKCNDIITMYLRKINIYHIFKKFPFYTFSSLSYSCWAWCTCGKDFENFWASSRTAQCIGFIVEISESNTFRTNSVKVSLTGHFSKFVWLYFIIYTFLMSLEFSSVEFTSVILAITTWKL